MYIYTKFQQNSAIYDRVIDYLT